MMEIRLEFTNSPKPKPADESCLGFGGIFTDHMLMVDYEKGKGWHDARIVPYGPIPMYPSAMCLHYGQEVFEGLKAYRQGDGSITLFRPQENFSRLNTSSERLSIPQMDEDFLLESLKKLLEIEKDWVPHSEGASLYIRPFIIAVDPKLGVHAGEMYHYIVILSPSGAYYSGGLAPVKILVEDKYVRAVKGGMGSAKTGGNYAASLKAQEVASGKGYEQVLWLDGIQRKYIEEVGAMNVFFVVGDEVITPELNGSILPGITRKSVIEMLGSWGVKVSERRISIDELVQAHQSGQLKEAFGTGTAAVISPMGELCYGGKSMILNNNQIGALSQKLYDSITAIQWGKARDSFGWIEKV